MDRVAEQLGCLITFLDGTVYSSNGELENNERIANSISNLVTIAKNIPPHEDKYKKITILYPDFFYSICLSNAKIYITKFRRPKRLPENEFEQFDSIN